jgi:acetoacetate decarboxylase
LWSFGIYYYILAYFTNLNLATLVVLPLKMNGQLVNFVVIHFNILVYFTNLNLATLVVLPLKMKTPQVIFEFIWYIGIIPFWYILPIYNNLATLLVLPLKMTGQLVDFAVI